MKTMPQISEAELEVMKVLWELDQGTSSQIVERLVQNTQWKPKTIQTLITRLVSKGAVRAEDTGNKAFLYVPAVKEEEYRSFANESFLKKVYDGSTKLMLASFIRESKLSRDDIEDLKKLLDKEA
ncbi:MAG: transcriptional repressor, CopY family [Clostridia bacterium]|jgi:BlaI family penicillinase repressor|nr:transcriptional repressor, CopY family [Clostridia bacterium]